MKKVEELVPDDYGAEENDPTVAKALHKADTYAKQFTAIVRKVDGKEPSKELMDAAMKWSAEYVEGLGKKKEA